jgi:hypothetical protein
MSTQKWYPQALKAYARRLNGISKQTIRISPLTSTRAGMGTGAVSGFVEFMLPGSALVHMNSVTMHAKLTASITPTTSFIQPPRYSSSLIARVDCDVGGVSVGNSFPNANLLMNILNDSTCGDHALTRRSVLELGGDQPNAPTMSLPGGTPIAISDFPGGLLAYDGIIDTGILPPVKFRLQLADLSVFVTAQNGITAQSYTLDDIYFSCEIYDVSDGLFYNLQKNQLENGGIVEYPIKNYQTFSQSQPASTGSLRFTVNTGSLDWVAATFVPNVATGANAIPAPVLTGTAAAFFRYGAGVSYQFNIGNTSYPSWRVSAEDSFITFQSTMSALNDSIVGMHPKLKDLNSWLNGFWVAIQSFGIDDPESVRTVQGLDTTGQATYCSFDWSGLNTTSTGFTAATSTALAIPQTLTNISANYSLYVFTCQTSVLQCASGKQVQLIA